ncbi:complement C1q-like protein 2 [Salminus brasiliensis]|uniref:complement C1q-like protein 2 n=1 Tax=Salminus brasiliensis TaxID=930266 RepID=UPI003B83220F
MMGVQCVCVVLLLCVAVWGETAPPAGLEEIHQELQQLRNTTQVQAVELNTLKVRLEAAEQQLKAQRDTPQVAFTVSLGSNGIVSTNNTFKKLIYKDVLTNIGNAYDPETGVFKAPVRGVYYIRFTATAPTDGLMSAVLYKNDAVQLTVHIPPAGPGSDTAANGAALLLEQGDKVYMQLLPNSHLWDNASHQSTFSGFLLYTM